MPSLSENFSQYLSGWVDMCRTPPLFTFWCELSVSERLLSKCGWINSLFEDFEGLCVVCANNTRWNFLLKDTVWEQAKEHHKKNPKPVGILIPKLAKFRIDIRENLMFSSL